MHSKRYESIMTQKLELEMKKQINLALNVELGY